jgi:hypothetical protein
VRVFCPHGFKAFHLHSLVFPGNYETNTSQCSFHNELKRLEKSNVGWELTDEGRKKWG